MTPLDNESYESSPLLESAGVDTRHSQTLRARLKSHVRDRRAAWESFSNYLRHAWKSYLEDFRYAWPLVWPDKDSGLQYRPIQCFGIFSFHRVLYLLVPYLFGTLVKLLDGKVQDDMIWFVLSGLFIGEFLKDYLCKSLQSWRWLEVALRSQKVISEKALAKYLGCPEKHETWATGGSLSDFNKGGCLNKCLEQILFVWIAIVFDLIMTAVFICVFLGIAYGMSSAAISLLYIYCVARNGQRSLPQRREVVEAKREKDAISYVIF
jgi:ABC-type bacteriocin/lantibiotic exporter with double-glycine peptidase domain